MEGIDDSIAEWMGRAGFIEVEVGLQSIKRETLEIIHRNFHPKEFLKGIRLLQQSGIEVMVDLIAGLPGDSLKDILRSIEWVLEKEAYDYLMLYPLYLLHSTDLYKRANELGLESMPFPPYLILRTHYLDANEIRQAFLKYEEYMAEEISPLEMPIGLDVRKKDLSFLEGLISKLYFDHPSSIKSILNLKEKTAYSISIIISKVVLENSEKWVGILKEYLQENPFSLITIEVPYDVYPEKLSTLFNLARNHRHILDRDFTVIHTPYRGFLIFSRYKELIWKWPDPREWREIKLCDGQKISYRPTCIVASSTGEIPEWFFKHIEERYEDPPEIRLWELPND